MDHKGSEIWTEKYRPSNFSEFVGQEEIVKRVQNLVNSLNIPHLLFAGPAGVGKSTLALIIVKQLFQDKWRENYLELNASDERGIDVVRQKVKDFARTKSLGSVPFKVIFLDEADALTREAQQALRRTMENFTSTCRFILSCITPDTKILLPEEVEITIGDFMKNFENKITTKVQNFENNIKKEDLVLASIKLDPKMIGKKTLEITTETGRKLKLTEDHKLLTDKGWKQASELTKKNELIIYPNLEGTYYENNNDKIINIPEFIKFVTEIEEKEGYTSIEKANRYANLKTIDKNKIISKIKELTAIIKEDRGLTKREKEVYDIIKNNEKISRVDIQKKINLSRIRTDQLLSSIEHKGFIVRYIGKKNTHYFVTNNSEPLVLRNLMDIKKIIEEKYNFIISYRAIEKAIDEKIMHGKVDRIIGELKRKNLLDISYNSSSIGALSRIVAFMLGDGHIANNNIRLYFSGNKTALENVKKDLIVLGYSNFSRISDKKIKNKLRGKEIAGISTSFYLDSSALSHFLQFLGIPKGDKVAKEYHVPEFVKKGTKFVKREFLRSLFGCEGDKPSCKRYNFNAISIRQNKIKTFQNNMIEFYNELKDLLNVFEIASYLNIRDKKEIRKKDLQEVLTFELILKSSNKNLHKFFSGVGYAYEEYKIRLSRLAAEYLKHKLFTIELWKEKKQLIEIEISKGKSYRSTAKLLNCTPDFVALQLKGKNVHLPRRNFVKFNEWVRKHENDCFIKNKIIEIKEIECDDVRDITCLKDHNFISNGFISHNCNYSSKIIDPIQSRCAIFRFRLLEKSALDKIAYKIAAKESLELTEKGLSALYESCEGDARRLVNLLQSTSSISTKITEDLVNTIISSAKPADIKLALEIALSGDFQKAREKLLDVMLKESIAGTDVIKAIQKEIWNLQIEPEIKVRLTEKTGEAEFRLVEGSDEFIQLEALLASFVLAGQGKI